jgi:UDP-N-acetylmuramoylalanine--D-glutamate ligase
MASSSHLGRVCVVGRGVTGRAVADYLATRGARVDEVVLVEGEQPLEGRFDLIVISPGIAPHTALYRRAQAATDDLISEVEFAYRESSNRWVAITGTNGKTTTTALTAHLLEAGGQDARAVGNIGVTAISLLDTIDPDTILVAEVSSFQLETARNFAPTVAAILNITPDHLDWHGDMSAYVAAKLRILANLDPGSLVLVDAQNAYFDAIYEQAVLAGSTLRAIDLSHLTDDPLPDLRIKGVHNLLNAQFAREIARFFEVDEDAIRRGLETFEPVRHRLQFAGVVAGGPWYNDSKATNPDAVLTALHAFADSRPRLLLGGRSKGSDMRSLAAVAATICREVICFGEAGPQIAASFEDRWRDQVAVAGSMREAMESAASRADAATVILSPACASFDEFTDYEARGEAFCAFVDQNSDER